MASRDSPPASASRDRGSPALGSSPEAETGRAFQYLVLAGALLVGAVLVPGQSGWSDPWLHTTLETAATVLALVVAALALVRYYSRRRAAYLFIGVGFLGAALLDGYHTVVSSPPMQAVIDQPIQDLAAWTWLASRLFLSLFLLASWWVAVEEEKKFRVRARRGLPTEGSVWTTAGVLTLVIFLFFLLVPIGPAYRPDALLSRPAELLPGLLFLGAMAGYLHRGRWGADFFEHALVVALLLGALSHLGFMALAGGPHDMAADMARLLRVASYLAVGGGLLASVHQAFRSEEEASRVILSANSALAREMAVRQREEESHRERERRLQDFLDHAHDLIQSIAPDGRILYVNETWKRTLGYSSEDLADLSIHDVIHPDHREAFQQVQERVFLGESVSEFAVVFQARDGSAVACSGSSNCRFEGGRPVATRSIFRNVAEEVRTREELARFQANLRALFESTGDAIWSVDSGYRLVTFNTAYALLTEVLTGRPPRAGDALSVLGSEETQVWFRGCYDRALAGSRFSAVREEQVDGQHRVFELFFNPVEAEIGHQGVVVFSRDITRRRRVEEALRKAKQEAEEANRSKSQFLANMSHELRTPLNSIIGFANILVRDRAGILPEKEKGYLERVLANGKHLLSLINEILDLSKIEAGRMEVVLEFVDLRQLVGDTLAQMEGQVAGRPVTLRWEVEGDPAPFRTDRGKLKQVLINLVGNALKFTEEGEVVLSVETGDDGRTPERIRIRDSGIGIPDDRLETIFQAFQQVERGATRRFGGTGLGLTISKSLCILLGYDLTVQSEVGKGSIFTLELAPPGGAPATPSPDSLEEATSSPDAVPDGGPPPGPDATYLQGRTILVVDDEADSRALLTHYLEELGCSVVTAVDGIDGLEVARRELPDLITLDLMMPRMSGWEMLRALREDAVLRETPVIVVSIVAEEGGAQVLGSVDLMNKPVARDELERMLNRNLRADAARVLVVQDRAEDRLVLHRHLRDAGLQVAMAEGASQAMALLQGTLVDLVLLDLTLPETDGIRLLEQIRDLPELATLPVVMLASRDLSPEEADLLSRHGVRVIQKGVQVEQHLRRALDRRFNRERGMR